MKTYKLIRTTNMIEGEGKSAVQVTEREVVATGLPWSEAKKRVRSGLDAIQEHDAAPVTVEE